MGSLRWITQYRGIYLALSSLLVLAVVSLVAWQTIRNLEADRELPLVRSLGALASTIESGTTNSQAMGAAVLLGLESREVKQSVRGQLPQDEPSVLSGLEAVRRQFIANAIFLVNAQGAIVAYSSDHMDGRERDISSWSNVQLAIRGTPNVFPSMGGTEDDRGIYLAAPVRATENNKSLPIGAVVIEVGADKLDMVLDSWTDGIAVLLSPQGEVFSANRRDWRLRKTGAPIAGIRPTGQAGAGQRQPLPLSLDVPDAYIDGERYAVRSQLLDWNDPLGDWRLAVLGRQAPWWAEGAVLGFSGLAGLVVALLLLGLYTLARHEEALHQKSELLNEAQAIAATGSYVIDIQSGLSEVSDETRRLFGIDETYDYSMAGWLALVHPEDRPTMESYVHQIIERGLPFDKEYRIVRLDDQQERWMHGLGRAEFDAQGRAVKMHGTMQDITERKLAEDKLRREHDQNQHYLDTTQALMVELDTAGNIAMINRKARTTLGYAEHELLGRNWFETCLPQPEGIDVMLPLFRGIIAGDVTPSREVENTILCWDGSQRLIAWRNSVLTDAAGNIVGTLSSGMDVTENRKLAQQLETILDESPTGIAVYREDGPCIMANAAFARLIGTTAEEVLKQDFRNNASWQRNGLLDCAIQAFETKSTVRRDIEGTTSYGKPVAMECIFAPINLSGKPHLLLLINDIMGRVEAERALNESMHQLEQKELSKTRFLAAAGHDLRQPIAAASMFVDALKLTAPNERQSELLQRLEQSMGVFSGLLDCLLDISKLDAGLIKPQLGATDLSGIFDWLEQNFSQAARAKRLRLQFFLTRKRPLIVRTDVELLKSILMNLVSNAIKFTSHGGILISARLRGDRVVLQVWDTGIGIAESHLPYIFDEFYQVSNPQRDRQAGLGLGLSSCQRRMALLGGRVDCRSRPGHGSVFEMSLPLDRKPAETDAPRTAGGATPNATFANGRRVVVIEDDKLVSEAMKSLLQALGAEVRLFNNAELALQQDDVGDTDYFIVDHNLGGELSGLQFLELMQQKRREKIRAVILTGETSSNFLAGVADSPWPVLNKPASIAQIIAKLDQ